MRNLLMGGILALFLIVILSCGGAEQEAEKTSESAAPTTAAVTSPTEEAMAEEPTTEAMEEPTEATEEPTAEAMQEEATEDPEDASEGDAMMEAHEALKAAAAELAGGPGAFYVGDLSQLVGPVPDAISGDIGDYGGVVLEHLEDYLYVYESDYYKRMIERANFTNPTEVTTTGMEESIQFACINRSLTHCK